MLRPALLPPEGAAIGQPDESALSSAAVALDVQDGIVQERASRSAAPRRLACARGGGVLKGLKFDDGLAGRVAEAAFAGAQPRAHNAFKVDLGKRVVARALNKAATMEI